MRVVCQSCQTPYAIDDRLIGSRGVRAQCPKCRHQQLVKKDEQAAAESEILFQAPRPPPPVAPAGAPPVAPAPSAPASNGLDALFDDLAGLGGPETSAAPPPTSAPRS